MRQPIARIVRSRLAMIAAGLMLAAGGLAVIPAASANAGELLQAVFSQDPDIASQPCSTPGDFTYPGAAVEIYNPCSGRVWIHYTSGSGVAAYCVNPDGGLAYDLPIKWAGGDTTDMQLTSNTAQCDQNNLFGINWCATNDESPCPNALPTDPPPPCMDFCQGDAVSHLMNAARGEHPDGVVIGAYGCEPSQGPFYITTDYVYQVWNAGCNFRIWLHYNTNGTGASLCLNPGAITPPYSGPVYYQVSESYNQAPCGVNPPYSLSG
jgi:hypothetical protein